MCCGETNFELAAAAAICLTLSVRSKTRRRFDAQLHGKGLRFDPGKMRDAHVTGWTKADEFISWPMRLSGDAAFEVSATCDAGPASAGNTFAFAVGEQQLKGTVLAGSIRAVAPGRIALAAGTSEIKLLPVELKNGELMQLRAVELKPVVK